MTAPPKDDDGLWVYDVNDDHSLWLGLLSSSCSSFRVLLRHRRLVLLRGKAAAASARDFEKAFRVLFSRDNKADNTEINSIESQLSFLLFRCKDHPSLFFVLFRASFAHTLTTTSSLTSSSFNSRDVIKKQISSDF